MGRGHMGDIATISFFPTKNFPGIGDGGMVVCSDPDLGNMVRRLRFHGSEDTQTFPEVGYTSRLDELQAAAVNIFLPHVDDWNERRRQVADWYREAGLGRYVTLPEERDGVRHIYHLYVVRHPERDRLRDLLVEDGIGAVVYYGKPMHLQPVFSGLGYSKGDMPVAEEWADTGLALPMHPNLTREQVDEVVAAVGRAVERI